MRITHLTIKNWRNFKNVEIDVPARLFVVGPNASGKSNFLDSLRFLRDVASIGGGFQQAIESRGGMSRVRSLAARNNNSGRVLISVALGDEKDSNQWEYSLNFTAEKRGKHRPTIISERVSKGGQVILQRPDVLDESDPERLTQTALEQVNSNKDFREIVELLTGVRYLHLVPQLIRDPARAGDAVNDPFGADFLARIAQTPSKTQESRLRKVNDALRLAVPQLEDLQLVKDEVGRPHLQARYRHWREKGARQDERDFSHGTLRLIGLLWSLLEGGKSSSVVLLEEPELSLHNSVVQQLPAILSRVRRTGGPQVIVSTHADGILTDPGLGLDEVLVLTPTDDGTIGHMATDVPDAQLLLDAGMSLAEILGAITRPGDLTTLSQKLAG